MHYTLTLNPAIDYFMDFTGKISNHQKTNHFKMYAGGKGINASIILNNLKINNTAIFVGGGTLGIKLEDLIKKENINYIKIDSKVDTRVNVKAKFDDTYELNTSGSVVNSENIINQLNKIINKMTNDDTLMIMGSLPNGMKFKHLETIVKQAYSQKVKLVFDLSKDHLNKLVKYKPEIIKPNKKELSELFNCTIETKEDAFTYAQKLINDGAKRVLVSFDKSGSIYLDTTQEKIIEGVLIQEVNGSGAGDSMISAFVAGLSENLSINQTLQLAAGAGTASASVIGIADKKTINKYKDQIVIKER